MEKNSFQVLLDYLVPAAVFLLFFIFYNNFQISASEMVKTTGLWSIALLGLTLIVGPISRAFPGLGFLRANRKIWGLGSFFVGLTHVLLVLIFFWDFNLYKFVDVTNPRYGGILAGLEALAILLVVTLTSSSKIVGKLHPTVWKIIQTTSYIALFLALTHFYIMETKDGVLVIKRLLGQLTFWFTVIVLLARILIIFLPSQKR